MLRRDKNFAKFWKVVKSLTKDPVLRKAVVQIQTGTYVCVYVPYV